jgi:hypothetical protein
MLGVPAFLVANLTGCGSSSTPAVTAAKNMYVIQAGQTNSVETDTVLVFPTTATGAATPASTLTLPSGLVAVTVATGPTGQLYVGGELTDDSGEILVFAPGATGAATPTTTYLSGEGSFDIPVFMAVNSAGLLFVEGNNETFEVFAANASPSAPPSQYITTFQTADTYSYGIGADTAGNMYVTDYQNEVIDVFAAGANGAATPTRTITGTGSDAFSDLSAITSDASGNIMVVNYNEADDPFGESVFAHAKPRFPNDRAALLQRTPHAHSQTVTYVSTGIYTFGATATGNATATSAISGSTTTVNEPEGLTADALDNMYYIDFEGGTLTFMSFKGGATGDVAPLTSATSTAYTGEEFFDEIAVY